MCDINYRIQPITVGSKVRQITLYPPEAAVRQKHIYSQYRDVFISATHRSVYSYIPGRSNYDAVVQTQSRAAQYEYFIKADIKDYFPSINRDRLRGQIGKIIPKADANEICNYAFCCNYGIAEGSALSPALSNIYLRRFDGSMSNYGDSFYIRYCDDFVILTNGKTSEVLQHIRRELARFGVTLNNEKLHIGCVSTGFDFLGFHITPEGATVLIDKVRAINTRIDAERTKSRKGQIARGFKAYYRKTEHLPMCTESVEYLYNLAGFSANTDLTYHCTFKKPKGSYLRRKFAEKMFTIAEMLCGDCA